MKSRHVVLSAIIIASAWLAADAAAQVMGASCNLPDKKAAKDCMDALTKGSAGSKTAAQPPAKPAAQQQNQQAAAQLQQQKAQQDAAHKKAMHDMSKEMIQNWPKR